MLSNNIYLRYTLVSFIFIVTFITVLVVQKILVMLIYVNEYLLFFINIIGYILFLYVYYIFNQRYVFRINMQNASKKVKLLIFLRFVLAFMILGIVTNFVSSYLSNFVLENNFLLYLISLSTILLYFSLIFISFRKFVFKPQKI